MVPVKSFMVPTEKLIANDLMAKEHIRHLGVVIKKEILWA